MSACSSSHRWHLLFKFYFDMSSNCEMKKIQSEDTIKNVFGKNIGSSKGLEIWRIEKFEPVAYPKNDYGKFYTGDSYIVLNTKETNALFSHDIHFWLGKETTQDDAGSAALLTVYLDDRLGGSKVQHREVEEHESLPFLSYFKNGIRYMPGRVESDFNQASSTTNVAWQKSLFQLKGKKNIRVRPVQFKIESMNNNDFFILDSGRKIFVYPPKDAQIYQKTKANEVAKLIRDQDHNGRATVQILDHPIPVEERREFFSLLGCKSTNPTLKNVPDDEEETFKVIENFSITLYVCAKPGCVKVAGKPLKQDMLQSEGCFLLDTGNGIFVWVGKQAPIEERSRSVAIGQEFIAKQKYPSWTQMHRIVEGAETVQFKQYFAEWREQKIIKLRYVDGKAHSVQFDPVTLHARRKGGRGEFMPEDKEKGKVECWRVMERELVQIRDEMQGMFFSKNCYVIKYICEKGGALYFWQGKEASKIDKGAYALLTTDVASKMSSEAIRVIVNEGYEPRHFLLIFKGKLITMMGNHAEYLKNKANNVKPKGNSLFKIRCTTENDVHAQQMDAKTSNLSSDDSFILVTPGFTCVWNGVGTSEFEKKMARESVERVSPGSKPTVIQEGSEAIEFWKALGGKGNYDKELDKPGVPFLDSRLFHCKVLSSGKFVKIEVINFTQDDLDTDDVFIMDGGDEIYIWQRETCSQEEKEKSMQLANTYLRTDPTPRTPETVPIITIKQGNEPRSFKQLFPKWKK